MRSMEVNFSLKASGVTVRISKEDEEESKLFQGMLLATPFGQAF